MSNAFSEADWKRWTYMFEEEGFELYESTTKDYVTKDIVTNEWTCSGC